MTIHKENKLLVVCAAIVASTALVSLTAVLDALSPKSSLVGFIIRTLPLAAVIPLVLMGFNTLCDRFGCRNEANRIIPVNTARPIYSSAGCDALGADCNGSVLKQPQPRTLNGNGSAPIIVPVSIHERFVRSVVPGKKWWVGQ
ncbi:MAG TPA: hypothetical protein VMJ32_01480 [Pirellulales bacterium]|nr:hypothetical protein [Pirellulales bacterium]